MDYCEDNTLLDNIPDNASEAQIVIWKTLVHLVKANPVLYNKKLKGYSKKDDKLLIWNSIGASMTPPMSGTDAEKEFYRVRQKFGKERRKVVQSQARSGAGTDHISYTSNWELYDDLMFLVDYIQPRRTTSNYQRPSPVQSSVLQTSQLKTSSPLHQSIPTPVSTSDLCRTTSNYQRPSPVQSSVLQTSQLKTSSPLSTPLSTSDDSRDLWNSDLNESLVGSEVIIESTTEDEKLSSVENSAVKNNASTSALKAMASAITPQKQTPVADIVKKKKRGTARNDETDSVMIESTKNISSLTSILETALKNPKPAASQQLPIDGMTPVIQNMMGSIAVGLSKVPEQSQMECLISVLSCINNFIKK